MFLTGMRMSASCPNPQSGGPVYLFWSGLSPLTRPAWETLLVTCYRRHGSQVHLGKQAQPLRQSRDTSGGVLDSVLIINRLRLIILQVFSICTSQLRLLSIITPTKLVLFTLTLSLFFIRIFNLLSCLHCFVWKR
jgi:hypothetical protein